jgi:hypothetical protein
MLTLYSYPELFGVADNNPFGLKVYAFMKLCRLSFRHEHVLDASKAPRGQLPYLVDGEAIIGDSDAIIDHLISSRGLDIDAALTQSQRDTSLMVRRLLDDLYWVTSYLRWKDDRFWPQFRDAMLNQHPDIRAEALEKAREYNSQRYYFQGIGRYPPQNVYARGIADLGVLANLIPKEGYAFGGRPCSIDAAIYGFTANIYFSTIKTPVMVFLHSQQNLVGHCEAIHAALQ